MRRWEDQLILLRDSLKMGKIVKFLPNDKYLVSFYDKNNKFKYKIISEPDIIDEEEYKKIKKRIDYINQIIS
jgi:hypothetical protein